MKTPNHPTFAEKWASTFFLLSHKFGDSCERARIYFRILFGWTLHNFTHMQVAALRNHGLSGTYCYYYCLANRGQCHSSVCRQSAQQCWWLMSCKLNGTMNVNLFASILAEAENMSGRKGLRIQIETALHFMKLIRDTRSHTHVIIHEFLTPFRCFEETWLQEKNKLHFQSIIASIHKCGVQASGRPWPIIMWGEGEWDALFDIRAISCTRHKTRGRLND